MTYDFKQTVSIISCIWTTTVTMHGRNNIKFKISNLFPWKILHIILVHFMVQSCISMSSVAVLPFCLGTVFEFELPVGTKIFLRSKILLHFLTHKICYLPIYLLTIHTAAAHTLWSPQGSPQNGQAALTTSENIYSLTSIFL